MGGPVLGVSLTAGAVRVSVADSGGGMPRVAPVDVTAVGGRGMLLVEELADSWGIDDLPGAGKCVWFLLGLTPDS
jgi:hypothetical protein